MLHFEFMQHAFIGCFLVSLLAGTIGWLLLLRAQAFAAHALPHIGFSGAAIALWIGISPLLGMIFFTIFAAFMMFMGEKEHETSLYLNASSEGRDRMTGLVLAASLGIGSLCLHEASASSQQMNILLFGNVLGLETHHLLFLTGLTLFSLIGIAVIWRKIVFITLFPLKAKIEMLPIKAISLFFMMIVAVASSACSEIAGSLLSFSLMIGPASAAFSLSLSALQGVVFSILGALLLSWGGLILSWYTDAPVSFWISAGAILLYLCVRLSLYGREN